MTATTDVIRDILKDSNYHLDLFSLNEVQALRERTFVKEVRGKQTIQAPVGMRQTRRGNGH